MGEGNGNSYNIDISADGQYIYRASDSYPFILVWKVPVDTKWYKSANVPSDRTCKLGIAKTSGLAGETITVTVAYKTR